MTNLEQFHRFVGYQLANGGKNLSPEECLKRWQLEQRERDDANEGIRRGLEDMRAGRGQPLGEFAAEFRNRNGLPNT